MEEKFKGLIAAAYTPMKADGSLYPDKVESLAEHLFLQGVEGVFVCGSTGEGVALSLEERMETAQRWVEAAGDSLKVIVHVGALCRQDSVILASHARALGAAAVSAFAPFYYKPPAVEELLDFLAPVAKAASPLPFYFYHVPLISGVDLPPAEVLEKGRERIPNLRGAKYTSKDLGAFQECLALQDGRFDILFGVDEWLLAGLALGAEGAVGSTYNYAAPLYQELILRFKEGDLAEARKLSRRVGDMVRILRRFGVIPGGKAVLAMAGVDCGPPRPPMKALDSGQVKALYKDLKEAGLDELLHLEPPR